jgi:CelD/BcsL family acetyltransferase involved in cellulose biosynthesis
MRFLVAREDGLDFLSSAYRSLYGRSAATIFQEPVWLDRLYRTLAVAQRAEPVVVTVRLAGPGSAGELVGVLPLVRRRRHGVLRVEFADLGVCDYAAPVLDRDHVDALLADATVPRDVRAVLGEFDLIQVERLAQARQEVTTLLGARATRRHSYDAHAFELPSTLSDWPDDRVDGELLRQLERKRIRLRPKGGASFRIVVDAGEVDDMMALMRTFRRDRFAGRRAIDLVQDPGCFEFYRRAAHDGIVRGGPAQLGVLDVGGQAAAVALDLVDAERHVCVLVGYDVARLRNYSLGLVIVDEQIRSAIAAGRHVLDLTVGDEGYKQDFGAGATPMYVVRVAATVRGRAAAAMWDLDAVCRPAAKRGLAVAARLRKQLDTRRQRGQAA